MKFRKIVIAPYERGLYFRNRALEKILGAGVHWVVDFKNEVDVQVFDTTAQALNFANVRSLIEGSPVALEQYFEVVALNDYQVALVFIDEVLTDVLAPGTQRLYWKTSASVEIRLIDYREGGEVEPEVTQLMARSNKVELRQACRANVYSVKIEDHTLGLMYVDGVYVRTLNAGSYAFWRYIGDIRVDLVDSRTQLLEITGQEILTRDKVSLRINLSAGYRIDDALLALSRMANIETSVYRELQLALRRAIAAQNLDALLADKTAMETSIADDIVKRLQDSGVKMESVGIKDIILPGDMKEILNRVVSAEKEAQANNIKRREETAATRSLLNTAKLINENPAMIRLKELECLEKVTAKVDRITVFGGLDGMMNDLVSMKLDVK